MNAQRFSSKPGDLDEPEFLGKTAAYSPDQPREDDGKFAGDGSSDTGSKGEGTTGNDARGPEDFYRAETSIRDEFGSGATYDDPWVATAVASEILAREGSPHAEGVIVRFENPPDADAEFGGATSGAGFVHEGGGVVVPTIFLGEGMRDEFTIVHEATHILGGPGNTDPLRSHGDEFVGKFADLLAGQGLTGQAGAVRERLGSA